MVKLSFCGCFCVHLLFETFIFILFPFLVIMPGEKGLKNDQFGFLSGIANLSLSIHAGFIHCIVALLSVVLSLWYFLSVVFSFSLCGTLSLWYSLCPTPHRHKFLLPPLAHTAIQLSVWGAGESSGPTRGGVVKKKKWKNSRLLLQITCSNSKFRSLLYLTCTYVQYYIKEVKKIFYIF